MKNWVHFLGGSVTVYLAMAACSAGSKNASRNHDRGSSTGGADAGGEMAGMGAKAASSATGASATGATSMGATSTGDSGAGVGIAGMIGEMMDPVDEADAAPATSGTRLRARYYVGDDGSKQFIGWHDKERDENCAFVNVGGVLRCIPGAAGTVVGYYSDAGCSVPLYVASKAAMACGGTGAQYTLVYDAGYCAKELIALTPVTPATIYTGSPAACNAVTPAPVSFDYFTKGAVVAWTAFVSGTEQID
jgi:hypothetical protein